ncbi:MAG: sulfatase-like hydrolase/transferase [Bryobacterales bacterium]|nr:sulfatase-like hydrolase/transferase [Bryobacterales bacterium]
MRVTTAIAALLFLISCSGSPEGKQRLPNFVVIMADDLGYGDLSTYGGWIDVPNIDRMAAEGLKFTDFHSNGAVCSPTRAALMTGRYQQRAGLPIVVFAPEDRPTHVDGLQAVELTFAEALGDTGYATALFGKWHLGYYPRYNPVRHGFDEFKGYVSGNIDFFSHVDGAGRFDWWHGEEKSDEPGYVTTLINKHSVRFIEDHYDDAFCLYVAHEAPHSPYQGPNDDPGGFRQVGGFSGQLSLSGDVVKEKYREMVVEMDNGVGAILETLSRLGIADRTLVLFFSDNGATPRGSNGSLRGHKGSVWEGGHRVPAVAWQPGAISGGTVTDQLAATMDVWPTLAELAGVSEPVERPLDGVSLVPVLAGGTVDRGPMFWSFMDGLAMRDGNWKLVSGEDGSEQPMLFDLGSDLAEANDVAAHETDRVAQMAVEASEWLRSVNADATPQPSTSQ